MIHEIKASNRNELTPLFSAHRHCRTTIEAVLEGQYGRVLANSLSRPSVAALVHGPSRILGGDAGHPDAPKLLQATLRTKAALVWLASHRWLELLRCWCPERKKKIEERPRFGFLPDGLRVDRLQRLADSVPSGFKVRVIDLPLAKRIAADEQSPLLGDIFSDLGYRSPEDLVDRGIGICATADEGQVVCIAYSEALSSRSVDIAFGTHSDFRRLGIATAVCATFIIHCLSRGIRTHWHTPFPLSCEIAEKLGYPERDPYSMYVVYDKDWRHPSWTQNN